MKPSSGIDRSRLIMAKLVLDYMRHRFQFVFGERTFGVRATDALLLIAVLIGQAEQRPMKAAKLAGYAGLPRSTAIRRLATLEREGFVVRAADGSYCLHQSRVTGAEADENARATVRLILQAASELSKLDT